MRSKVGGTARIATTLAMALAVLLGVSRGPAWGCRYSVRDVAFVHLHGTPWQLHLVSAAGTADSAELLGKQAQWRRVVREELTDSNVQHAWFDAASPKGKTVLSLFDQVIPGQPCMAVVDSEGMLTPVDPSPRGVAATIRALVDSPVRSRILDVIAEALCAIVVVENNDPGRVAEIQETVRLAARQVHDQMWMLEKPTRVGPVVINVPCDQQAREKWLLKSLGIEIARNRPAVAIVFGQGRRLGPVLYGEDIQGPTIVARASLCGRDCECDLDRRWLYGSQMIHRWPVERQRAVEDNLDFDPYSALVLAEVQQIMQKTNRQVGPLDAVDLGPGLRIHDLATGETTDSEVHRTDATDSEVHRTDATDSEVHRTDATDSEVRRAEATDSEVRRAEATDSEVHRTGEAGSEVRRAEVADSEVRRAGEKARSESMAVDRPGSSPSLSVPWKLILALAGLAVILTALAWFRATR